ncbi:MAG: 1-acyl-sn-glycerol-3-phosphate acyltransferase [Maritimibacter sp.]|nr:1-acyl-sn-glycerol-3-phosphate acyltransferase [Maritimibacter sp.]
MSQAWPGDGTPLPETPKVSPLGWLRVALRGAVILVTILTGLVLMLFLRLAERPLFAPARPVTPWITQGVCSVTLWALGIRLTVTGDQMRENGAVVANHASWLDIFVLNARKRIYFVSKDEVAGWPGISWLAKATGTVFIRRDRREAGAQVEVFRRRLGAGHKLLFFPEGTSTDSRRVLPFKTTLFAAFFDPALHETMHIQPVTVLYRAPKGQDARFFGWYANMELGPSLLKVLAQAPQGSVELVYHPPLRVADYDDRKRLAKSLEEAVRAPMLTAPAD